jgi:amino acid adenylation domain-containing protein
MKVALEAEPVVDFPITDVATSIPERFEQIARRYGDRVAIRTRDRLVTYEALNTSANRIGRAILERIGSGSEPIALLFGNGTDLISALLGVLKAGKFFVAIDPSFPSSRINFILKDTDTRLLVTNSENTELSKRFGSSEVARINIDELKNRQVDNNLGVIIRPDDIATIVYTSGSTGEPKGVIKTHGYCWERAKFNIKFLSVNATDRLSLLHSISFGSGEINLYASLLCGASLQPFDVKSEGIYRLAQWLKTEGITIFHCSPSVLRELVEFISQSNPMPSLRLMHLSGSPITHSDFDLYHSHFSPLTSLAFHMGATEAGCIACAVVDHDFTFPARGTPAGFPPENKKVSLLDDDGREVSPGGVGEIAVKSKYLAHAYWKNPDLTRTKFLPDPNGGHERTYLTGDLGQILPDGLLVHLGRKDLMVKIRGYRVEIAEIEMRLTQHPAVKDAGVTAWERDNGDKYLTAYIVSRGPNHATIDQLRMFLRDKLPGYMVPSTFMFLDSLPVTNGKLDRRALPEPNDKRPELSTAYALPTDEIEKTLASIWEKVLDVRPVGIHDNFFDLGGHSLSATQVISQVIKQFQLELPLQSLFQSPTVAKMAAVITQNQAKRASEAELPQMLREVEAMTEEEAQRRLDEVNSPTANK